MPLLWPTMSFLVEETCLNKNPDEMCEGMKRDGMCTIEPKLAQEMCKKTCGFCGGGSGT